MFVKKFCTKSLFIFLSLLSLVESLSSRFNSSLNNISSSVSSVFNSINYSYAARDKAAADKAAAERAASEKAAAEKAVARAALYKAAADKAAAERAASEKAAAEKAVARATLEKAAEDKAVAEKAAAEKAAADKAVARATLEKAAAEKEAAISEIQALTQTQVSNLNSVDIVSKWANLLPGQKAWIIQSQIQALTQVQLLAVLSDLTDTQVEHLTEPQINLLSSDKLQVLFDKFSDPKKLGLTSGQIANLRPVQQSSLTSLRNRNLTQSQIVGMTQVQLSGVISDLTILQIPWLTNVQAEALTEPQINLLSSDKLQVLFDKFSDPKKLGLTSGQIANLTTVQKSSLTSLRNKTLTEAQIQSMTQVQLSGVISDLTPAQIKFIPTSGSNCKIQDLSLSQVASVFVNMSDAQKTVLVDGQISASQKTIVDGLKNAAQTLSNRALTQPQIQSMTQVQLSAVLSDLTIVQIRWLTNVQAEALTEPQINLLSSDKLQVLFDKFSDPKKLGLTSGQIANLTTVQKSSLTSLRNKTLTEAQIQSMTQVQLSGVISDLTPAQIKFIPTSGSNCKIQDLSLSQVASVFVNMSDAQKTVLVDGQISASQKTIVDGLKNAAQTLSNRALTQPQIQSMTQVQLSGVISDLTPAQIKFIPTSGSNCKIQDLSLSQVSSVFVNMSDAQKTVLVDDQISASQKTIVDGLKNAAQTLSNRALTQPQIQSMTQVQLSAVLSDLTPPQIKFIPTSGSNCKIQGLSLSQVSSVFVNMSDAQKTVLVDDQISASQKTIVDGLKNAAQTLLNRALTQPQIQSMTQVQLSAVISDLTPAQIKFIPTSGSNCKVQDLTAPQAASIFVNMSDPQKLVCNDSLLSRPQKTDLEQLRAAAAPVAPVVAPVAPAVAPVAPAVAPAAAPVAPVAPAVVAPVVPAVVAPAVVAPAVVAPVVAPVAPAVAPVVALASVAAPAVAAPAVTAPASRAVTPLTAPNASRRAVTPITAPNASRAAPNASRPVTSPNATRRSVTAQPIAQITRNTQSGQSE